MNEKTSFKIKFIDYLLNKVDSMFWTLAMGCGFIFFFSQSISELIIIGLFLFPLGIIHSALFTYKALTLDNKDIKTIKSSSISQKYNFIEMTREYAIKKSINKEYWSEFNSLLSETKINNKIDEILGLKPKENFNEESKEKLEENNGNATSREAFDKWKEIKKKKPKVLLEENESVINLILEENEDVIKLIMGKNEFDLILTILKDQIVINNKDNIEEIKKDSYDNLLKKLELFSKENNLGTGEYSLRKIISFTHDDFKNKKGKNFLFNLRKKREIELGDSFFLNDELYLYLTPKEIFALSKIFCNTLSIKRGYNIVFSYIFNVNCRKVTKKFLKTLVKSTFKIIPYPIIKFKIFLERITR